MYVGMGWNWCGADMQLLSISSSCLDMLGTVQSEWTVSLSLVSPFVHMAHLKWYGVSLLRPQST